jgi:GR25 family glycosyltransferase involved in LPS biosynthesis
MIIEKQPKTFVICFSNYTYTTINGIKNSRITERFYSFLKLSLDKFNWNWSAFSAIDGWELTDYDWLKINVNIKKESKISKSRGAQGCFYSHFLLWKKCLDLNEPIIILEQDAIALSSWIPTEMNFDMIKLGYLFKTSRLDKQTGVWFPGSWAYLLSPEGAKKLIAFSEKNGVIPVDRLFGNNVITYQFSNERIFKLNTSSLNYSTTNGKTDNDHRIT